MDEKHYYICEWAVSGIERPAEYTRPEGRIRAHSMEVIDKAVDALRVAFGKGNVEAHLFLEELIRSYHSGSRTLYRAILNEEGEE